MNVSARAICLAALVLTGCGPAAKSGVVTFDLANFRQSFNAAADHPRMLVMLSPT